MVSSPKIVHFRRFESSSNSSGTDVQSSGDDDDDGDLPDLSSDEGSWGCEEDGEADDVREHTYMTSAEDGGRGVPKKQTKGTRLREFCMWQGGRG